ncbi:MAG: ATP-binding protein [Pseudomonadota bacterium]
MPAAVIGRERELDVLSTAAADAAAGRGCVVFLAGPTGSGKSSLLKAAAARIEASETEADVVRALCYQAGTGNPLGPFLELLATLANEQRRGERAKRVLELVGQVAPPLVGLIPVVGSVAAAGVKAASDLGVYALGGSHEEQQLQLAADVATALRRIAADRALVLVIDDAHWIDAPSTEVVVRLAAEAEEHALAVVLSYDPELVGDTHPLALLRATILGRTSVRDLKLEELSASAVDDLLVARYGALPARRLGTWLHDRTHGNLLFLEQYLLTLEEQGLLRQVDGHWSLDGGIEGTPGEWRLLGRLATVGTPDTLLEVLRPRLGDLTPEEVALLEAASVQGSRFLSLVLARVLEEEEPEVVGRLKPIARRRMVTFEDVDDWWGDDSELVSFDPAVLQQLLYGRAATTARERRRGHRAVAEALEALVGDVDPPPRRALLEIARHYEEAREPVLAAARLVEVAESTYAEGADRETALHAGKALELLGAEGARDGAPATERLFAKAVLLLLLGGEASWRTDTGDGERLFALAAEAERAAESCGDLRLRANAHFATALLTLAYRGLDAGVAAYREALALAREAGDAVAEFAVLLKLGHHLDSVDLREGAKVLEEAHDLLASGRLAERLDPAALALETARLESALGVASFDLGRYGEAGQLLGRSATTLETTRLDDDYAWALAFLGQLQTALGLWDEAEETLRRAIAVFEDDERPLGARGYFRSLLGRIGVERDPPQLDVARRELEAGRRETHEAAYVSVEPLVDVHWAELLLAEGTDAARREADELLAAAPNFGWARGEIAMASLRARIALDEGRLDDALTLGGTAYERLTALGGAVPAVRSEEIVFTRACVLERAAPGSADAKERFAEAAAILLAKADSLTDAAERDSLLHRVRLSRAILARQPAAEPSS